MTRRRWLMRGVNYAHWVGNGLPPRPTTYAVLSLWAMALGACTPRSDVATALEACHSPTHSCVLSNGMSLQTLEPPRVLAPINVSLRDVPVQVTAVRVEASMTGMAMPPVGVDLRNTGPAEWRGELVLPVCSQGRSDWTWTVVTRIDSGERRTALRIETAPQEPR